MLRGMASRGQGKGLTTRETVGQACRHCRRVGSTAAEQAMPASSAWLQMYCTASGPSVSYSGTLISEYAQHAASTSTQSARSSGSQRLQSCAVDAAEALYFLCRAV